MLTLKQISKLIKDKKLICPSCKHDSVFFPKIYMGTSTVWCRDHGHWAGEIEDCFVKVGDLRKGDQ